MTRFATIASTTASPAVADPATHRSVRVDSIDVLRALTMVLMIFVNDLWSLRAIPVWLEHVPSGVDGIGLADVVFPAFLFIVGLSMPFAIEQRRSRGDSAGAIAGHIVGRTVALLVMGLFLVNGENLNEAATGLSRFGWNVLACTAFILIWNGYPKTVPGSLVVVAKLSGVAVLLGLAFICRGGEPIGRFDTYWWGILGLIGWSYLAGSLITGYAQFLNPRNRILTLALAWAAFALLSMVASANGVPLFLSFIPDAIRGGTLTGLTLGGALTATVFKRCLERGQRKAMTIGFLLAAAGLIALSVGTRPIGGLSKLGATPAWLFLCSAFTLLAFTVLYWLVDVGGKTHGFRFIKPAGTDTLLCYLMPYFAYAGIAWLNLHLPPVLLTGGIGLLKSLLFALLCVWVAGGLNRLGIRLKL